MTFEFRIATGSNGATIIDTTKTTEMESLTPSQQIEYIETACQLYQLERATKAKQKLLENRAKRESETISYIAGLVSVGMTVFGAITFDPWLFITGIGCACLSTNLSVSLVSIGNSFSKANEAFENSLKIKFPKFWDFLNS